MIMVGDIGELGFDFVVCCCVWQFEDGIDVAGYFYFVEGKVYFLDIMQIGINGL